MTTFNIDSIHSNDTSEEGIYCLSVMKNMCEPEMSQAEYVDLYDGKVNHNGFRHRGSPNITDEELYMLKSSNDIMQSMNEVDQRNIADGKTSIFSWMGE